MPCREMMSCKLRSAIAGLAVFACLFLRVQGSSPLLLEEWCGVVPQINLKIANGKPAEFGGYPWIALLHQRKIFFCAGSLLNHWFVLTAGHCISDGAPVIARLGEYNRDTDIDCDNNNRCLDPVQDYKVDMLFRHRLYNDKDYTNDIGMLRLERKVEYTLHIQPICIIVNSDIQPYVDEITWFKATGWGRTSGDAKFASRVLLELDINRRPKADCVKAFRQHLTPKQICVGNDDGNLCNGDSGGPQGRNATVYGIERFVQLGIASYTNKNCSKVSILTDVTRYGKWIRKVVEWYGR
ncbi:serine protease grass [Drosophila santomea]|uniref:serine protease grass n=1 Tax=Drosophila santomea TaxID=129105 RepID=UPI001953D5C4|nr:serine protease grass [Drosophila santomea]